MATGWRQRSGSLHGIDADIPAGNIYGLGSLLKFGRASNVVKDTITTVWDGNIDYPFPATADITHIRQDTDQAAMRGGTISVQGCDIDDNLVEQTVTLDASDTTTLVALDTPLFRINRKYVTTDVSLDSPIKTVNAADSTPYSVLDYSEGVGNNQTLMAVYSVPAGYDLYITQWYAHFSKAANKEPDSLQLSLWQTNRGLGYAPRILHSLGGLGGFVHPFKPHKVIPERSDVFVRAYCTGQNADISAGFDGYLVKL